MKKFSIVVAATSITSGIGRQGKLPWKLSGEMNYFKSVTSTSSDTNKKNAVIMGRKTFESIPAKFRPLESRVNVILSRNPRIREELALPESVLVAESITSALEILGSSEMENEIDKVFVIGGSSVYVEAIALPACQYIYMTRIHAEFPDLDTHFPCIPAERFQLISRSAPVTENSISYRYLVFEAIPDDDITEYTHPSTGGVLNQCVAAIGSEANMNVEEQQYLDIVRDILTSGVRRGDRTGTGTISKFGVQMRFSLRDNIFPLLTTKKVFWRGVAEELIWFIKGSTNAKELSDKGVKIWDGNGSKEFLTKCGLGHREEGDLGPVYGFQWRHFGAEYTDMHATYEGKGIDQLKECIHKIINNPEDRRIIMTAWNPSDLSKMALPPCHMFCQFYVANGELSCQMYQRSADMGLGVPFNIASYALLTVMMAQVCGLQAGDFVHTIGDAHIYANHEEALREQIQRQPKPFPRLYINPVKKDIDSFEFSDFTVDGYNPEAAIKMKMAV